MVQGFESRIKIQEIIDNQLPEFVLDESPKLSEFLKQYYISQEYQGGPVDILENLDQYIKFDNLTPEVVVGTTTLSENISSSDDIIKVTTTKGFPQKYGLIKIDDEIITYTGITTNTFTGCVRGFSGITNYQRELNYEELVFSTSESSNHTASSTVENLSVLFLKEFYKKIKYTLLPELQNKEFVSNLNVGNFIKEVKTLYQTKGTEESFRILFNVLFGETPKVIDHEKFLIKPSASTFIRREIVVADAISGNPFKLAGQTIFKSNDINTSASVSEVEIIQRKGKTYYKLFLFIGFSDYFPTVSGTFNITGNTKVLNSVSIGSSVISVDSTIGFPNSGKLYTENNIIEYTDKSINQFFGCSGIVSNIETSSIIYSEDTYYGYEDGDLSKKVEFRLTGVLSNYESKDLDSPVSVGEKITIKNIGEIINNPIEDKTYKEIFANSWVYNTSSRFEIESFSSGQISQFVLKSEIDKSNLKVGDYIEILYKDSQDVIESNLRISSIDNRQINTFESFTLSQNFNYDIRRKIKNANSSVVPLEFVPIISEVQNVYNENDDYMYVASNSLPSYQITKNVFSYNAIGVDEVSSETGLYSRITFSQRVSFITGSEVYYTPSNTPIFGLSEGVYYVEVLPGELQIKLYSSRSVIGTVNYLSFGNLTEGSHNFRLNYQKERFISPQKILRKFPLSVNNYGSKSSVTDPGATGILINGVEIFNYKSSDKIYYGGIESVRVLNGGKNYDVINPPLLSLSSGDALVQPVVSGSIEKIYVDPQDFDIDVVVSVSLSGGNGSGSSFEPVVERRVREIEFDARQLTEGGGVDIINETITFTSNHGLIDGQPIVYRSENNPLLGIGNFNGNNSNTGFTLKNGATYYTKYVSDTTIQLYQSILDYRTGINTVGFTTIGTSGIQKFVTEPKNKLTEIKVINGGSNYTNRKLRVTSSGISTSSNIIRFNGHGFNEGDLVVYSSTQNLISGLSTEKQYYVIKVDDNNFRLSDAGIGGTDKTNYLRKKYVKLESTGTGYQIFNYPEISLVVEYSSVGLGTTQFRGSITATPVVRGKIIDAYVYNSGSNYGSTILNYHKKPSISIKSGKDAQFVPIIVNGKITDVSIQYSGSEYYSTPEILVVGDGKGALLKPIVTNNKITDVVVINSGYGYSSSKTYINIISSGSGAILDPQVRSLTVNTNKLFRDVNTTSSETNELLISSYNNLQYAVCGYSNLIKTEFSDNGLEHSKIIGWAYDGNPIYGAYGYSDPKNKNSSIKKLVPGYTSSLSNISNRPSEFPEGFFVEDYKFTNSGDLDRYNGRFCVTPEFPNGTYAYFSTFKIDQDNNIVGSFPYFIGNEYKSKYISENKFLNQSFDFNNSKLTRNTFPYKLNDRYADNDFITESNEIINQVTIVESVLSGSVNDFEIINEGDNYKVGDNLEFDDLDTDGGGLSAQVSELTGKEIININTSSVLYNNAVFTWSGKNVVNIKIEPYHNLSNLDYVSVSGLSTSLSSLNGFHKIGVTSYTSILIKDIPSSGIVTDIYVSNIPKNISIGSSVGIGTEILSIINIFESKNILRVGRGIVGASHTATSLVYFKPDTITIENPVTYFESFYNNTVYFNPNQSIGVGTTPGLGFNVLYNIGIQTNNTISIPSQTLYLPNHPFTNNQEVTLVKPSSSSAISVANTSGGTQFNLPIAGNTQKVYIIKKSQDHIGIVTQIGLTTTSSGLFFISNGSNDYGYYLQSNFKQVKGNIDKIVSTVSVSTSHGLKSEDTIGLVINPNLSVGIGTSTSIKVKRDANTGYILIDTIQFNSSGINTETNTITISQHNLNTGDKVKYSANTVASGLTTGFYYVYKVDNDKIKLSETFIDSALTSPPNTIDIFSTGGSSQNISKVNPNIKVTKNNNIVFDLSDSSLVDYNFKLFCDQEFKNEFVSTGSTNQFSLVGVGTIGISSTASLTLNYSDNLPNKLFYSLEKFGVISEPDKDTQNYSEINFVESFYNGSYTISGVGNTTFNVFLRNYPERLSYSKEECDLLKYTTSSTSTSGGISKIRLISSGNNYKKLPIFKKITSLNGTGAYVIPKSDTIGKVNEIRIVNEGFEYSSDKTLRPQALVPRFAFIKNSNTINNIFVTDGGKNYISPPNLVIINSETREKINSGLLVANLSSNTISSVLIDVPPTGLPETIVDVKSINNTNGIKIQNVKSSLTGIVTCVLVTPLSGFGQEPFSIGDKIFVEGIQIEEGSGEGLNSEDYGYQFFTVSNYLNANTTTPRQLEFSVSGFTTNPGIAKSVENFYGTIINYKNYPKFEVIQDFSNFVIGELLEVKYQNQFIEEDLLITESNKNYIKLKGSYDLRENQIIRGTQSGSIATIEKITKSSGQFVVNYSLTKKIGWQDNIGNLNDDIQVVSDNDYYQRLAYSVKSTKEWNEIVSPVNSLLHPSGLKNFSNTEIIETTGIGTVSSEEYIYSFYDIINENRVDTIYNYDLVNDIDTVGNNSLFLKFKNKKLTDYVECTSNRALEIDDISSQFSTRDSSLTALSSKVDEINKSRKYNHYLVQISSEDYSQTQFNEIIVLNDDFETFTLEKGSLSTGDYNQTGYNANQIGDLYGYIDEFGSCYLKFDPKDPYNTIYNIKFVNTAFTNYLTGIGSTSIGFVSLTGITSTVSVGSTAVIESKNIGNIESIHSQVHIIDNVTNEMNYVEVYVDHDGTDTNIAEFYFDSDDGLSSNFIGSFGASVSNGILSLKYTNNTSNSVTIRSKNVGFGTTSIGIGTYRFKQSGQIDDTENTVRYDSLYQNVSLASTIFSFDTNIFTSVKSVIRVSIGKTSALHQLMIIANPTEIYTTQYPFLSIGSTSGIGTFGGELSGSVASIKFYPDPSLTGTFEVLSFNQNFYKENDYINTPPDLEYSNVSETIQVKKYYGINLDEIDRLNFPLNYKNTPIFTKTFNPSNSSILNLSTGEFNITNHFFSTGEELIYRPNSTFVGVAASSVGIGLTMNYVGVVTNILPEVVYAIKISNDKFKLSTRKEYASAGIYVTFTSTGSGNSHELEMSKKNEKSIITVNNIIQSPITYSLLDYTINNGTQVGASSTIIGLSGISSILIGDILKIDNEYMKVTNVGVGTSRSGPISFGGTFPLVSVTRGFFGSISTTHSNLGIASVYRGSFNIVKNDIYFVDPPEGSLEDQILSDLDNLPESRAYFSGRVFLKSDYTSNRVYDDISEKFDGKTQTYTLTVGGANTVGLGTSGGNGIVIINGIYQTPTTANNVNNNFKILENNITGISSIVFSGITSSNGSTYISQSDVNMNELPRGGLIVSLGSTPGLGYAPLVGASVTAIVSGGSIISIGIGTTGNWGSGYKNPVSIAVTESGHSGLSATITATVGAGGTLSFTVVNGGSGYTNPIINISPPNYSNLSVIGVSRLGIGQTTESGSGLLLDIEVGSSSTTGIGSTLFEVVDFKVNRNGYGFKKGDVVKVVGLVTAYGLNQPISEFQLTVLDTYTDKFAAWQFGELDYIDSIENYQNGSRRTFPLYYNSQLLSFEKNSNNSDSQLIDFDSLLVIFINGVLQQPGVSYQFEGGTSFTFTTAPKPEDNISIYFYRGSSVDSKIVDVNETIKPGDDIQVFSNNNQLDTTVTQNSRILSSIVSSSVIETNLYNGQGIDEENKKPLAWTKQKSDKLINGNLVSKERDSIETQIYPTAKIIKNVSPSDTEIFVDNAQFFNYENEVSINFDALMVAEPQNVVSAGVTAVVSSSGTIQSLLINNSGSGYSGSTISLSISAPPRIGTGIGTVGTATASIVNGSLSTITITNPGFGYNQSNPPQVLVPSPEPVYENIQDITSIQGSFGNVVGIATTVGIGTNLAIKFTLSSVTGLQVGYPIYIFNTKVGSGVTSIVNSNSNIVGIGTSYLDNVYYISAVSSSVGIITCNIHSNSSVVGIATTGSLCGNFSWGRLYGSISRSPSPISINVSGFTVNSGLSSFPTIQRRGYGLRNIGSIKKAL